MKYTLKHLTTPVIADKAACYDKVNWLLQHRLGLQRGAEEHVYALNVVFGIHAVTLNVSLPSAQTSDLVIEGCLEVSGQHYRLTLTKKVDELSVLFERPSRDLGIRKMPTTCLSDGTPKLFEKGLLSELPVAITWVLTELWSDYFAQFEMKSVTHHMAVRQMHKNTYKASRQQCNK